MNNRKLKHLYMVTLCLMGITFYACTSEETVKEQPEAQVKEVCYVATIGGDWKTRTMYEDDGKERPSLVAKWGSVKEKTETISLYTSEGQFCGNLKSTIPAGGAEEASFSGTLAEGLTPAKAYYYKSNAVTSLDQELSLLSQVQNMSGSTAHISSQDYMVGTVDEEAKKITFEHMTAVIKYVLSFEEENALQADLVTLRQVDGASLNLSAFWNGSETTSQSCLNLSFNEDKGKVSIVDGNLIAYVSAFPSSIKDEEFTLFVRTETGLYETEIFTMTQNLEAGKLYTLTSDVPRLTQYDWFFNPAIDEAGNVIYSISTAEELSALSEIVNGTSGLKSPHDFEGETIQMTKDISLKDHQPWTPIGKSPQTPFRGTFDGLGHTVSDMLVDNDNEDYQGFFGVIEKATIQNLTVLGTVVGREYVGGLVGKSIESKIVDCTFGNPEVDNISVKGLNWVGGVIGFLDRSEVLYSENYGDVTAIGDGGWAGGIAGGGEYSSLGGCGNGGYICAPNGGAAGIMGQMIGGSITGCYNDGEVSLAQLLAGIIANMQQDVILEGCCNRGFVNGPAIAYGNGTMNGCLYTQGEGDKSSYREKMSQEDYDSMNEWLVDDGYGYDIEGGIRPTDDAQGNVDNFGGGGYLE